MKRIILCGLVIPLFFLSDPVFSQFNPDGSFSVGPGFNLSAGGKLFGNLILGNQPGDLNGGIIRAGGALGLEFITHDGTGWYNRMNISPTGELQFGDFFSLTSSGRILGNMIFSQGNDQNAGIIRGNTFGLEFLTLSSVWNTQMVITNEGNIGIGTSNPSGRLEISGASNGGVSSIFMNQSRGTLVNPLNSVANGADGNYVVFRTYFDNQFRNAAYIAGTTDIVSADAGRLFFSTRSPGSDAPEQRMVINSNGNVGIGTSDPTARLEITGAANGGVSSIFLNQSRGTINGPLNSVANGADGNYLVFRTYYNNEYKNAAFIAGTTDDVSSDAGRILFSTRSAGASTPEKRMVINSVGDVGIGTDQPDAKLTVKGEIHTEEVIVDLQGALAPDFVFEESYELRSIEETEAYIQSNKHLPEIPSAKEMGENGLELKQMNLKLLQKVEELTLYLIEQNKEIKQQRKLIEDLQKQVLSK